jgi:hypothetical protein
VENKKKTRERKIYDTYKFYFYKLQQEFLQHLKKGNRKGMRLKLFKNVKETKK